MHNGLFELEGILNMYEAGMVTLKRKPEQQDDPLFPTKSPHLQPLELSDQDKADLLEFLRSLTERKRRLSPPELPALGDL
jgi:cytochrome c peroxidase